MTPRLAKHRSADIVANRRAIHDVLKAFATLTGMAWKPLTATNQLKPSPSPAEVARIAAKALSDRACGIMSRAYETACRAGLEIWSVRTKHVELEGDVIAARQVERQRKIAAGRAEAARESHAAWLAAQPERIRDMDAFARQRVRK